MDPVTCGFVPGIPVKGLTPQRPRIEQSRWRVVKCRSLQNPSPEDAWKIHIPEGYEETMRLEGEPGCESCAGNGSIACAPCMGTGVITVEMFGKTSSCTCHLCGGKKTIPCPVCKRMIYSSVVWWKVSKLEGSQSNFQGSSNADKLVSLRKQQDFQKKKDEAGVAQLNGNKAVDETDG